MAPRSRGSPGLVWRLLLLQALAYFCCDPVSASSDKSYLIITTSADSNVYYAQLPTFQDMAKNSGKHPVIEARMLIDGQVADCSNTSTSSSCGAGSNMGLQHIGGVAVHQGKGGAVLYVSDLQAGNVYSYPLWASDDALHVGRQSRLIDSIQASRLAVDMYGHLFYTDTASNSIGVWQPGSQNSTQVLYQSSAGSTVISSPMALVADNFFVYWGNQDGGETYGSVVKALERPNEQHLFSQGSNASSSHPTTSYKTFPSALSANTGAVQGVCLARDNIFYTGADAKLYGLKMGGGSVTEVFNFDTPQGCVYDREGTLYVADAGANAIYALPANFVSLRGLSHVSNILAMTSPAQLALFTVGRYGLFDHEPSAAPRMRTAVLWVVLAFVVMLF